MKILQLSFFLCVLTLPQSGYAQSAKEVSFIHQWDTVRVLKNPHKGWYHHLLDNGISKYPIKDDTVFAAFPGMDHLYLRLCWSYLEPREGKFDWHYIDEVAEKYVPEGYKISFRISCSETGRYPGSVGEEAEGVQYATPSWVRKAGAKGILVETRGGNRIWVPRWDDPVFLAKLDQFHKAFAERYDGQPWVSYVDIGSIGDWGEGHTSSSTNIPATIDEIKANINIFLKYYKKSQLVSTDDLLYFGKTKNDREELYDFATSNGITLRDDSPMVMWYIDNNIESWSIRSPEFFDPLYFRMPIVFELQHYGSVKKDGNWLGKNGADTIEKYGYPGATIMRKAIETMHATYIGYHGYAEEWLADNPDLTEELANLCGYWYFPVKASFPSAVKRGKNELSIVWLNKGVAPAYDDFNLVLRFESENPKNTFDVSINSGNKAWLPGLSKTEQYNIDIPSKAGKGIYNLKFRLAEQIGAKSQPIHIGVKESFIDEEGFIVIGSITI
jgi:hypothetical protein